MYFQIYDLIENKIYECSGKETNSKISHKEIEKELIKATEEIYLQYQAKIGQIYSNRKDFTYIGKK